MPSDPVRLDVWLDVACLFRTRSEAQKACKLGRLEVNGQLAKPHRPVHPGDKLDIRRPYGRVQHILVKALADRHLPKDDARQLYEDQTPPPDPAQIEIRRIERIHRALMTPPRAPDKRERRAIRKFKRKDE